MKEALFSGVERSEWVCVCVGGKKAGAAAAPWEI